MRLFLCISLFFLGLISAIFPAWAFDDDFEINNIDLDKENFLDINAHRFRKSLEYQWFDSVTAWRITGASLSSDIAFLQTELKLQHELSESVNVRLKVEQEVFYADKDFPLPTTELEFYPWFENASSDTSWAGDLGFSLLGTPAHEKREIDLGVALIWGRRPWDYIRFEYLDVDANYNRKNKSDNTFYSIEPVTRKLEGAYRFGAHYKLRFAISHDEPLELIDPDNSGIFKYEASDYFLLFDYQPMPDTVIGVSINGLTLKKSKSQTGQNLTQETDYISTDVYWVKDMGKSYEFRFGVKYDHISSDIRDYITTSNHTDYDMDTLQLYSSAYHPINQHMAWDLGLYVGQVAEKQIYLLDNSKNTLNDGTEAKFRMGYEYSSSNGRNSLQVNISLNLDDLFDDPGDGGGISFQSVF